MNDNTAPTPDESYSLDYLSGHSGVSKRTIRYYVQTGLLPPPLGAGRGARYNAEHLARLQAIGIVKRHYHLPNSTIRRGLDEASASGQMSADSVFDNARNAAMLSYENEMSEGAIATQTMATASLRQSTALYASVADSGADYARRALRDAGTGARPSPFAPQPWAPGPHFPGYPGGVGGPSTPWGPRHNGPFAPPIPIIPTIPPIPNIPAIPGVPMEPTGIPVIPGMPYPTPPYPVPPYQKGTTERSTWDRVSLNPDFELQVRRPLTHEGNRALTRIIEAIQRILDEEGAR